MRDTEKVSYFYKSLFFLSEYQFLDNIYMHKDLSHKKRSPDGRKT